MTVKSLLGGLRSALIDAWNHILWMRQSHRQPAPAARDLGDILRRAERPSDISDHLVNMWVEGLLARPRLIVELGVRGGESTFVMERIAARTGAQLVSVDIEDCSSTSHYEGAIFVQADDIEFGSRFPEWCQREGIALPIDLLFVDTNHEYEHTVGEIDIWFQHLAEDATVIFHDTHLTRFYRRRDGSVGSAWNNDRGVIRALEGHLGTRYDETVPFVDLRDEWLVRHDPACCGLTVLTRISSQHRVDRSGAQGDSATTSSNGPKASRS